MYTVPVIKVKSAKGLIWLWYLPATLEVLLRYACGLSVLYCALGVRALRASVYVSQMPYYAIAPSTDPVAQ